jgi:hypothetical protein
MSLLTRQTADASFRSTIIVIVWLDRMAASILAEDFAHLADEVGVLRILDRTLVMWSSGS